VAKLSSSIQNDTSPKTYWVPNQPQKRTFPEQKGGHWQGGYSYGRYRPDTNSQGGSNQPDAGTMHYERTTQGSQGGFGAAHNPTFRPTNPVNLSTNPSTSSTAPLLEMIHSLKEDVARLQQSRPPPQVVPLVEKI
jgi:hypothetical protein